SEFNRKGWLDLAFQRSVVRRSLAFAIVVGAILILINHGEAILQGEVGMDLAIRMGLTVFVPYVVSTPSSVGAMFTPPEPFGGHA
ncbi:MAG: nitrate/nitrite transporter NrtS, partial [Planctomycetes bacterium]|nr:nitrate/nitrite transporter NrtS [Planctomycetota bacterium]